jgi:hypothetical protein
MEDRSMKKSMFWPWLLMALLASPVVLGAEPKVKKKIDVGKLKPVAPRVSKPLPAKKTPTLTPSSKAAPTGPAPEITCDKPEFNFGTVAQGEDAKHVFTVKNKGKGVLKIERARGG